MGRIPAQNATDWLAVIKQDGDLSRNRMNSATAAAVVPMLVSFPMGPDTSTVMLAVGVFAGTFALVVLAALLHGASLYLNSRWRYAASVSQNQKPEMRSHNVRP